MNLATRILLLTLFILFISVNGFSQSLSDDDKPARISEFEFKSIIGKRSNTPENIYCLLGTGFFTAPHTNNTDSLVADWIAKHKDATVVPISSMGPVIADNPHSKLFYCLITQGSDTLNNLLIRNGNYPGGTMIRPRIPDEMPDKEKESWFGKDKNTKIRVYIKPDTYDIYIRQIHQAEIYARENKLGVWNDDFIKGQRQELP